MSPLGSAAFVSYSREDSEFALRLAQDLKAGGANVWLDQIELIPGLPWDNAIEEALLSAPQMLVILSPTSVKSENVRDEISYALKQGKTVIPVLYMECVIPLRLERKQHIDFRNDYARGLAHLLKYLGVADPDPAVLERAANGDAQRQAAWQAREAEGQRLRELGERSQREDAERKASEEAARKASEEADRKASEELRQRQEADARAEEELRRKQAGGLDTQEQAKIKDREAEAARVREEQRKAASARFWEEQRKADEVAELKFKAAPPPPPSPFPQPVTFPVPPAFSQPAPYPPPVAARPMDAPGSELKSGAGKLPIWAWGAIAGGGASRRVCCVGGCWRRSRRSPLAPPVLSQADYTANL